MLVVLDIDGTIANGERRFKNAGPEPDRSNLEVYNKWVETVNTGIGMDYPVQGMQDAAYALWSHRELIYLTSREEQHRLVTEEWLKRHGFPPAQLFMRPNGDSSPTPELKEREIRKAIQEYTPSAILVIDDDEHGTIEAMCHKNGWTFLKARSGGQK